MGMGFVEFDYDYVGEYEYVVQCLQWIGELIEQELVEEQGGCDFGECDE